MAVKDIKVCRYVKRPFLVILVILLLLISTIFFRTEITKTLSFDSRQHTKILIDVSKLINVSNDHSIIENNLENWTIRKKSVEGMVCSRFDAGPPTNVYPQVLTKTVFHKTRFVFVVGLEGTGHHLFKHLLANCKHCTSPMKLPNATLSITEHEHGLFGSLVSEAEVETIVKAFNSQKSHLKHVYPDDSGKAVFLNTLGDHWVDGEASYPNWGGPCRGFKYPEVRILAEIMENLDLDFRVLVLVRSAVDILLSTTVHRHYSTWTSNALFYTTMLEKTILQNQLLRLDKKFIRCMDYDELPSIDSSLGDFLGVDSGSYMLQEEMKKFYKKSEDDETRQQEATKYKEADVNKTYKLLQQANQRLRDFCNQLS